MEIISLVDAFEAGLTRYFTGVPCKNGHLAPRMVCNSSCSVCSREITRAWKRRNPEKTAEYERDRARRNPDHVKALNLKRSLSYRALHLEEVRKRDAEVQRRIRKHYPEKARAVAERQRNKRNRAIELKAGRPRSECCEICGLKSKIVFDHCHTGGHFRGWICDNCNKVLGLVKDNTDTLQKMIEYLENDIGKANLVQARKDAREGICGTRPQFPGLG